VFLGQQLLRQIEAETPTDQRPDPRLLSCFKLDSLDALVTAAVPTAPLGGPYSLAARM
jgi:hypothetical protein